MTARRGRRELRCWRRVGITVALGVGAVALGGLAPAAVAQVSVTDASVTEGDSGTVEMTFTITHDGFYEYETNPGTAETPDDYESTDGGNCDTSGGTVDVTVLVNGDTLDEPNETFTLDVTDCSLGSDSGEGTILDDDATGGGGSSSPDSDGDGVPNANDVCPSVFARTPNGCPADTAGQVPDSDGDGVSNATDACPLLAGSEPNGCPAGGLLPPPVFGSTVNLSVLDDDVFIRLPAGFAAAERTGAAQKGQGFVPLIEPRQVPVGTLIDTEDGRARVESARNAAGASQFGNFAGGLFQVLQARRAGARTVLRLKGSSFSRCGVGASGVRASAARASAARRRISRRVVRRLTSNANGRFRTRGRHSAATVRGTVWVTADRCDGTLTYVRRGRVAVRDFRRRRTVIVRPGKPYLAPAPR